MLKPAKPNAASGRRLQLSMVLRIIAALCLVFALARACWIYRSPDIDPQRLGVLLLWTGFSLFRLTGRSESKFDKWYVFANCLVVSLLWLGYFGFAPQRYRFRSQALSVAIGVLLLLINGMIGYQAYKKILARHQPARTLPVSFPMDLFPVLFLGLSWKAWLGLIDID